VKPTGAWGEAAPADGGPRWPFAADSVIGKLSTLAGPRGSRAEGHGTRELVVDLTRTLLAAVFFGCMALICARLAPPTGASSMTRAARIMLAVT
jgi:hypothetical protein